MAILIDGRGLLEGRRLRKLGYMARLYYPITLSLSNFYARLELDSEVIALKLALIKDPTMNEEVVEAYFAEYAQHGLCFLYEAKGSRWAQFDTPVSLRRNFASSEDNASPAPPKAEYTAWLKSLHGDDWQEYNLSQYQQSLSEKRSEAGRAGGKASGEARKANGSKSNAASANEPVEVDVAVVEKVDGVEGEDVAVDESTRIRIPVSSFTSTESISTSTEAKTTATAKAKAVRPASPATPDMADQARVFADIWGRLMAVNPHWSDTRVKKDWKDGLVEDFGRLLAYVTPTELAEMMAFSQIPSQCQWNYTTKNLLENTELVADKTKKMKKAPGWTKIWNTFVSVAGIEENPAHDPNNCTACGRHLFECECFEDDELD